MAIQAQMYPENLGLPLGGGGSQDWLMDINHNNLSNINTTTTTNNNNNLVFNGCGLNEFSFNLLQKQQQQQQQSQQSPYQQQQQLQQQYLVQFHNLHQRNLNQNQSFPSESGFMFLPSSKNCNNSSTTTSTISTMASSDHMSMNLSQSLAAQLEKQRQEIDRYITLQNERLKLALQQQSKHQLATIVRKLESKAAMLLKQKDEEIAKSRNRTLELEERLRNMEVESQAWQRVAAEKEAMVVSLNSNLQQLREQQACSSNGVDDAQSCCDDNDYNNNEDRVAGNNNDDGDEQEEAAQETGNKELKMMMMMACRCCNARNSCMLLLPCRHLCSCKDCEPFIHACPLCRSPKSASIEALFS